MDDRWINNWYVKKKKHQEKKVSHLLNLAISSKSPSFSKKNKASDFACTTSECNHMCVHQENLTLTRFYSFINRSPRLPMESKGTFAY